MNSKSTVLTFLGLLFSLTIINLFWPVKEKSETENTYLQQMPQASWNTIKSGKFTSDFEKFVTDQFMARDTWLQSKLIVDKTMGRKSSHDVYFAQDGYLIDTFTNVDTAFYIKNLQYAAYFANKVEGELAIPVYTILAPSAGEVLKDKLPRFAPEIDQNILFNTAREILPHFIDVSPTLKNHSEEYLYYRTDHHWTSLGAYYAYSEWREQAGLLKSPSELYEKKILSQDFYGTSWSKAQLFSTDPDIIEAWIAPTADLTVEYNLGEAVTNSFYVEDFLTVKDKYSVFLNENKPVVKVSTGAETDKKLLLIKDSYANSFAQMPLADYSEIHLIDLRYYRASAFDYIKENSITDVLLLYSIKGFAADTNVIFLEKPLTAN